MNSRPIARVFAPAVFLSLVLLSLGFSFGSAQAQGPASPIAAPRIERFDLDPPDRLVPGEALIFRLSGSARGKASVRIDGVGEKLALKEVMAGIYEGAYTIKNGDSPWKIAKQFNMNYEDIVRLNGLDEDKARNLQPGEKIRVK